MKQELVDEVMTCLQDERRTLYYFKDRYCLDAIDTYMREAGIDRMGINELRKGAMGRFVNKPIVAQALKHCGDGHLWRHELLAAWPKQQIPLQLTLASWGDGDRGWDQTTRNQSNLVLQLNFDHGHCREYERRIKPSADSGPFESWNHPVVQGKRKTLAWVRLDIDFDTGEALIEEIQSDWIRFADRALRRTKHSRNRTPAVKPCDVVRDMSGSFEDLVEYVDHQLTPYRSVWAEAAMYAAINFIRNDLGLANIYYHSFETGGKLKKVYGSPPKSLYIQLPKQFGFESTDVAPAFLQEDKFFRRCIRRIDNPRWQRLSKQHSPHHLDG